MHLIGNVSCSFAPLVAKIFVLCRNIFSSFYCHFIIVLSPSHIYLLFYVMYVSGDLCHDLKQNKYPLDKTKKQQILIKKEMCTDLEIISPNHDDGTWADVASWLWTAELQWHFQIIANDWVAAVTAVTTNMLMDGSTWSTSVTALWLWRTKVGSKRTVRP